MANPDPRRWVAICLLLGASACRPAPVPARTEPPGETPAAGDTLTRAADGMVMVYVPGTTFRMGSDDADLDEALHLCDEYRDACERAWFEDELPAHDVTLGGFWIDRTEVTNGQYERCVAAGDCTPPFVDWSYLYDSYYGNSAYDDYPALHMTWNDAGAYCTWAGGRLPTEAEWEYAARGPEGHAFPWGDAFDGTRLNYCDANCDFLGTDEAFDDGYDDTAPVGSYPDGASWCGALDLAGNAREYVLDWYGRDYYGRSPALNPTGADWGAGRVVRGGSWATGRVFARCTFRMKDDPREVLMPTGFRCVVPAH